MYGGPSSKLGRPAAHNKRLHSSFPPPPRPSAPAGAAGRLSIGGGSARKPAAATASKAPPAVEETFNLVAGSDALAFSMIIRLAPDLVDEIRRVEAQGGRARMKFDPNPHNPNGNIIDVGGKEFRFTWSKEFGDLCDIYEERQSGEDGNGLFVESGSAWRKLNVQRILDESTKNHLKMRSVEAEQRSKQRKAIVLEPGNPSMKSQIKQLAAVEATPWKNYNKKKEAALKKRKVETLQVGGPPKTTHNHKSGFPSTTTSKSKISSPLPSPPDPFAAASSPLGAVNTSKGNDDAVPSQMMGKQDTNAIPEKEIPTKTNNAMRNSLGGKGNNGSKPTDLQGMLVSLLMDKPKGMSLKALEKAVGDMLPNSEKKIEPIIKKIAKCQYPGKYILKPGVDLESIKKPQNEIGSSPDDNNPQMHAREGHDSTSARQGGFQERVSNEDFELQLQGKSKVEEEINTLEKVDTQHTSPDIGDEKRGANNSEGQAGSSSESGSDSDTESDSSDSGSESGSRSRSRSRSPAGTGSGSTSDSDSDASSSSKEVQDVSDEDVDIMTSDDEKESRPKPEASDPRISLPGPVKSPDGRSMQNEFDEKQDGNESDAVEIEKDLPEEQEAEIAPTTGAISNASGKFADDTKPFSPDLQQLQERQNYIGSLFDERESDVKDSYRHEQSDSSDRLSIGKKKRASDMKNIDEKSERTKRLKTGNLAQGSFSPGMDVQMLESSQNLSPPEFAEGNSKGPTTQLINRADRPGNTTAGLQKGFNHAFPGKPTSDLPHAGQRTFDHTSVVNSSNALDKPESVRNNKKQPGRDFQVHEASPMQKEKSHRDAQNEVIHAAEKKVPRNSRDGGDGSKQLPSMDSHYQNKGKMVGKYKEGRLNAQPHLITSPNENNKTCLDKSPVMNGRGAFLQREHSDLELGELRESTPDEAPAAKQFDRKGSFKHVDKEVRNADISKARSSLKATLDSGKQSPALVSSGFPTNQKNSDNHFEDTTRSHSRVMQSQSQHLKSDHVEVGSQNKFAERSSKFRNNEVGASQDIDLEGRSESNRRAPVNVSKQQDNKRGTVSHPVKENKRRTPNLLEDMADGGKDLMLVDTNNSDQKKRESSSDENSCSYSKYEKDEPELKGPIKNFTQYKEYVQEYRDKYDSYSSLNKVLESYRNEFMKLGKDLENAKGRDMERYYEILGQMKESYRRCGTRHQRLKKIFIVLHEELEHIKRMIRQFADSCNKE